MKNNDNHHANPSAISAEVEAMRKTESAHKEAAHPQNQPERDKGAEAKRVHTNGSTPKDQL